MGHWVCRGHGENVAGDENVQRFTMEEISVATWGSAVSLGLTRIWV